MTETLPLQIRKFDASQLQFFQQTMPSSKSAYVGIQQKHSEHFAVFTAVDDFPKSWMQVKNQDAEGTAT